MTSFMGLGAFLVWEHQSFVDGNVGDARGEERHEEFVEARHQGDWPEVGRVVSRAFVVDEDRCGLLPMGRYLASDEAAIENDA